MTNAEFRISNSARLLTLCLAAAACNPAGDREPHLQANTGWTEPVVEQLGGVRFIESAGPREVLEVLLADKPVGAPQLLFWGDQTAARNDAGYQFAANTQDHEILMFDEELQLIGTLAPQGPDGERLRRPFMVAAGPAGRFAAFEASGSVVLFDRWGREFRRIETPFAHSVGVWARDRLTLARSPFSVAFASEPADAPLLFALDPEEPEKGQALGRARAASQAIYTHAANAGTVTTDSAGNIYYAALGRPDGKRYAVELYTQSRETISAD